MRLKLTKEEKLLMSAIGLEIGIRPSEIVRQFVSDLTESTRTHGSDEREFAKNYLERTFFPAPEITEEIQTKIWRLQHEAMLLAAAEREKWRLEYAAKGGAR